MSNPIMVACSTDASFSDGSTPSPWHADAVGGRPPHHPTAPFDGVVSNVAKGGSKSHSDRETWVAEKGCEPQFDRSMPNARKGPRRRNSGPGSVGYRRIGTSYSIRHCFESGSGLNAPLALRLETARS